MERRKILNVWLGHDNHESDVEGRRVKGAGGEMFTLREAITKSFISTIYFKLNPS